jgi:hypothetical protein
MYRPTTQPEEFLHYIWENKLFYTHTLTTVNHESLEVIDPGRKNRDSGPDFFNARIRINHTLWIGNVEIHKQSSDWYTHNHDKDKAYDNVILHVVSQYDKPVYTSGHNEIPTLEMHYSERMEKNYQQLLASKTWIACEEQFHKMDLFAMKLGYHRLMIERLESKTEAIHQRLKENKTNWNETFYQFLARMFGFKKNNVPFELLSRSLPLHILAKHKSDLFRTEALLFGNAGLLNEQLLGDPYYLQLREEYSYLYRKYQLKGIESHLWKFMRLRPGNFPSLRIAQFAALIHHSESLFSKILEIESLEKLQALFQVTASKYWDTHYRFNKKSKKRKKDLGSTSINTLIINVVVPFLFVYGDTLMKPVLKDRALDFLEQLPPERNSVIAHWEQLGITTRSAFDTQALLQLKNAYCDSKRCLHCHIGNKLIHS